MLRKFKLLCMGNSLLLILSSETNKYLFNRLLCVNPLIRMHRSTFRPSRTIRSVSTGSQWSRRFDWSAPLVHHSNWSNLTTESESRLGPYVIIRPLVLIFIRRPVSYEDKPFFSHCFCQTSFALHNIATHSVSAIIFGLFVCLIKKKTCTNT